MRYMQLIQLFEYCFHVRRAFPDAVWSKAFPLTASCLLPLDSEKVASDLRLGGGFRRVLRFQLASDD